MVRRKRGKTAGSKGGGWEAVSRVVFPVEDGQQVMPLYAIDFTRPRINEAALATSGVLPKLDMGAMTRGKFQELVRTSGIGDSVTCDSFTVNSRTQITVRRRGHASLCTFFNAFPAAYWRRWTSVREVRFSARVQGSGTVRLFKSTGRGLVYAAAEERALVRRGYFIEGLGAAQFASPATVDAVRSYANIGTDAPQNTGVKRIKNEEVFGLFEGFLLAATDPANPYGAALTWPSVPSLLSASSTPGGTEEAAREGAETVQSVRHRPGRKAGACLILLDGEAVLYLERGGKTLLSFTADPLKLEAAAPLLARIVQAGIAEKIVVEKLNDCDILATPEPPTHRGASKTDSNRLPEHPVVALRRALLAQGFYTTPRGLRMRRSP